MSKKKLLILLALIMLLLAAVAFFVLTSEDTPSEEPPATTAVSTAPVVAPIPSTTVDAAATPVLPPQPAVTVGTAKPPPAPSPTRARPAPPAGVPHVVVSTAPAASAVAVTPAQKVRAEGRRRRKRFPVGVILNDAVMAYDQPSGQKILYEMRTGDFVRVLNDGETGARAHIHPGLDIFLAATSKDIEAAGENLPDVPGWVDKKNIFVFDPGRAKEFLEGTEPMTIGDDPAFSTLAFYERAMKNPDPVVHRVIGPRMISILDIHEDYSGSWRALYRDRDPKIRSVSLAALRERGVGNSRLIIEDLITRLSELTATKAQGETEAEALAILDTLKASGHPRVRAALQGFADTWKTTQGDRINESLQDILAEH